jgi:Carboxypeptidase regulatory-like domain
MRTRIVVAITIGVLAGLFATAALAVEMQVERDRITGRVFESSTGRGIAALSVQLTAPRVARQPVRITITNTDGEFAFKGLTVGKYLLTIYRGTTLLFRKEIDNRVASAITVPLRVVPMGG